MINNRHPSPCSDFIFEEISVGDMFDFDKLGRIAKDSLIRILKKEENNTCVYKRLTIYVSGYTPALIAILNSIHDLMVGGYNIVSVDLMHYDKVKCKYYRQYYN